MTAKRVRVDGLEIEYADTGTGPIILFVHGVYVTGTVWNDVVAELGAGFRCIVPTWPLGAHSTPTDGADLGAEAAAPRIVHFMEALDLSDVTVVANDTGGGLVLASLGDPSLDTSRIARLVLTNCDSYEHFPPGSFAQIVKLCRFSPALGGAVLRLLATGPGQAFFLKAVCHQTPSKDRQREVFGAFATNPATRRDAVAVTASLDPALTLRAAPAIEAFDRPVTLAWGIEDDALFPLAHAHRLRDAFPNATLIEIPDCSAFVMLDAPGALADAIRNG
jgi:pimeloyl-ACP methyl ester carboxylesterase